MHSTPETCPLDGRIRGNFWSEREWYLLLALAVAIYFSRISAMSIRGEETRRATVAIEMTQSGQWIVPQLQGDPIFMSSRPPLQAWWIAAAGWCRGGIDVIAVRLPSAIAVLGIATLVYVYCRRIVSTTASLAGGVAFVTFAQVLQLGRLGETDLPFAIWVAFALLGWHAAWDSKWPAWQAWSVGYLGAALATLTKGPQGPVYFLAPVVLFLLVTRNINALFQRGHLVGIGVYLLVWGSWQLAFLQQAGWEGLRHIYLGDVVMYGRDRSWSAVLGHLVKFPLEVFCGALLPWSVLLLALTRKNECRWSPAIRQAVIFGCCAIIATFPSVWFVTHARSRFYLSLYPVVAMLVAIAFEGCWEAARQSIQPVGSAGRSPFTWWTVYSRIMATAAVGCGGAVLMVSVLAATRVMQDLSWWPRVPFQEPLLLACGYCAACLAAASLAWAGSQTVSATRLTTAVLAIGGFCGLTTVTIGTNETLRRSVDRDAQMAQLREQLPPGTPLVSLDRVDHCFAFYWGEPVRRLRWPANPSELPAVGEYFCWFTQEHPEPPQFAWELVGTFSSARHRGPEETFMLVAVARRLEDADASPIRPVSLTRSVRLRSPCSQQELFDAYWRDVAPLRSSPQP